MSPQRRLFSSDQMIAALLRPGFSEGKRIGSSHRAYIKTRPQGGFWKTIVVLGEREIKRGTFESILEGAGMTYEEFEAWARVKKKGRR